MDPLIQRFFKDISKLRPLRAKYDETWDPDVVLNYTEELPDNDSLDFQPLTENTITLLDPSPANRPQIFLIIHIENIKTSPVAVE